MSPSVIPSEKGTKPVKQASNHSQVPVLNQAGETIDTLALDHVFLKEPLNQGILYQAAVRYQVKSHRMASTKDRAQVSGGGKKPWAQKHTGRARHGSIRSPLWRHGGVTFGPHPKVVTPSLPKRILRQAICESLKDKIQDGKFFILESFTDQISKTRQWAEWMDNLEVTKPLFVLEGLTEGMLKAARNIRGLSLKSPQTVGAWDVMIHRECILTRSAYNVLLERIKKQ